MAATVGQTHPLSVYFKVWGWLFVLSALSYAVDYFQVQGGLRWSLILIFMMLKAGGIVWIFMHMGWERLALKITILGPPVAILVLIWLMALEGFYVEESRLENYGESTFEPKTPEHH